MSSRKHTVAIIQNVTPNHHHAVYIDGFARHLVGSEFEPIVILQDTDEAFQFGSIPYQLHLVKGKYKSIIGQAQFAANLGPMLDSLGPVDIIHTMNPFGPLATCLLWKELQPRTKRPRILYDIRGLWVELGARLQFFPPLLGRAVDAVDIALTNRADGVIAISQELKRVLIGKGVPEAKIDVMPGGVDLTKFNSAAPFAYATEWGWDGYVIGYVSSIGRGRNSDTLIRAFKRVVDQIDKPVYLAMIGPVRQMEYFDALIHELNLEGRVKLPGYLPHDQVPSMVRGCDIVVSIYPPNQFLFDRVRSPYKVLEYLGAGMPILVDDNVCHTSIVTNMQDALIVEPSEEDIANGLILLLQSPELRAHLAQHARCTGQQYDFANVAEQMKQIYTALLP